MLSTSALIWAAVREGIPVGEMMGGLRATHDFGDYRDHRKQDCTAHQKPVGLCMDEGI